MRVCGGVCMSMRCVYVQVYASLWVVWCEVEGNVSAYV